MTGRRLQVVLDFELEEEPPPAALADLTAFLAGVVTHQDAGTAVGVRDLARAGIRARLACATVLAGAEGELGS